MCSERLDVPAEDARIVADNLVEADLRGVASHGVVRFGIYAAHRRRRHELPGADVTPAARTRTTAVMGWRQRTGASGGRAEAMQLHSTRPRKAIAASSPSATATTFGAAGYTPEISAAA